MIGRDVPRDEHAAKPAQVINHGLQQTEFEHGSQKFEMEGQILAASILTTLTKAFVDGTVRRVKAGGDGIDGLGLQALEVQ